MKEMHRRPSSGGMAPPLSSRFRLAGFYKWMKGGIFTFFPKAESRKVSHVVVERIMQALFRTWASPLKFLNQVYHL